MAPEGRKCPPRLDLASGSIFLDAEILIPSSFYRLWEIRNSGKSKKIGQFRNFWMNLVAKGQPQLKCHLGMWPDGVVMGCEEPAWLPCRPPPCGPRPILTSQWWNLPNLFFLNFTVPKNILFLQYTKNTRKQQLTLALDYYVSPIKTIGTCAKNMYKWYEYNMNTKNCRYIGDVSGFSLCCSIKIQSSYSIYYSNDTSTWSAELRSRGRGIGFRVEKGGR
jgi:hypothetical protein